MLASSIWWLGKKYGAYRQQYSVQYIICSRHDDVEFNNVKLNIYSSFIAVCPVWRVGLSLAQKLEAGWNC